MPECKIGERTVRQYVHHRKIALGMLMRETCVPQNYAWCVEAQVDWYEPYADLAGERVKLQVFAIRELLRRTSMRLTYHGSVTTGQNRLSRPQSACYNRAHLKELTAGGMIFHWPSS